MVKIINVSKPIIRSLSIAKSLAITYSFFYAMATYSAFSADTLIKTELSYMNIGHALPYDMVSCREIDDTCTIRAITNTGICHVQRFIMIVVAGDVITTTIDQPFYVPKDKAFKTADKLRVGDELLAHSGQHLTISNIELIDKEGEFYDITVDECHNFFVSRSEVLVHNFAPVAIGLTWAFGGATVEFIGASIGTAFCGITLGIKAYRDRCNRNSFAIDLAHLADSDSAQAPGKPTEKDGYIPPKKWDDKKVKHPKTGQCGYPDKKGNVWVPTGPKGHGGPHWDVVKPNGTDYDNISPGGKIRKGKK